MGYRITLRTSSIIDCEQLELASGPDEVISELSLQTLVISNLPQTTALPKWLQGAACTLQSLIIVDCPKLAALPEWLPNLTSLQTLGLQDCPKLSSLPEGTQRLTSLTRLLVSNCKSIGGKMQTRNRWWLAKACSCSQTFHWSQLELIWWWPGTLYIICLFSIVSSLVEPILHCI